MPYLQLIPSFFEASAIAAVYLFLPSMKADIADYDEFHTSRRREGAINAFYSWFWKASLTCAVGLGGWVIQISGFDAHHSAQPEAVLQRMRIIYILLPLAIWSFSLLFIARYSLDRSRMGEIRTALENRALDQKVGP